MQAGFVIVALSAYESFWQCEDGQSLHRPNGVLYSRIWARIVAINLLRRLMLGSYHSGFPLVPLRSYLHSGYLSETHSWPDGMLIGAGVK